MRAACGGAPVTLMLPRRGRFRASAGGCPVFGCYGAPSPGDAAPPSMAACSRRCGVPSPRATD